MRSLVKLPLPLARFPVELPATVSRRNHSDAERARSPCVCARVCVSASCVSVFVSRDEDGCEWYSDVEIPARSTCWSQSHTHTRARSPTHTHTPTLGWRD